MGLLWLRFTEQSDFEQIMPATNLKSESARITAYGGLEPPDWINSFSLKSSYSFTCIISGTEKTLF
ncbi:MAG: hypothetical protein LPK26_17680 [Bacillaceae bacterium]|nr:hypothetical protein [Bacillaceae bacterium]